MKIEARSIQINYDQNIIKLNMYQLQSSKTNKRIFTSHSQILGTLTLWLIKGCVMKSTSQYKVY